MRSFPQQPTPVPPQVEIPQDFPPIPQEIVDRFPESARDWQRKLDEFWTRTNQAIQQAQDQTARQVNANVVFSVDSFLIYANGVPTAMFALDASGVRIGNVLTVDTPGNKMFIGAGNYQNDDTPFYIDTLGFFSLGSSLTWDPDTDTLTITGIINATSGTIGGFDIGADYIRDTGNTFGLASTVTGGDDVRLWAGSTFANRATAPFYVNEDGDVKATALGIGTNPGTVVGIQIAGAPKVLGTLMWGIRNEYQIGSVTTVGYRPYESHPSTAASAFTLASLIHFFARQGTIGAGSAITEQTGFYAGSELTGAASNYGFRGEIAAAANRYNLYMVGTAQNYLAGDLSLNTGVVLYFGGLAGDTNLYRSAADTLKTDDSLIAVGSITGAAGSFTTLGATGNITYNGAINGGVLVTDGTVSGQMSPSGFGTHSLALGTTSNHPIYLFVNSGAIAVISATGLAVTGGLSVTGLAGVGTRNVVVDAAGVMSAP